MSILEQRRNEVRQILGAHRNPITQARRVYLDRPSFALTGKHDSEFEIKSVVADRYGIPFRSVVFTGSAHLGFSPQNDTEFKVGESDLDIACVDSSLYLHFWHEILKVTRGFNDTSIFQSRDHPDKLKDHILRRGMILIDFMPTCELKTSERQFLDQIGRKFNKIFGRISIAFYISEQAFCQKQVSALSEIMGLRNV